MSDTLKTLATQRGILAMLRNECALSRAAMENTTEGKAVAALDAAAKETEQRVKDLEAQVRAEALDVHRLTATRQPWPGVEIKMYRTTAYDQTEALGWCQEHAPKYVKPATLDKAAFEKAAPVLVDLGAPVVFGEEPRVFIASDLERYQRA